jgi:2-polyprenyl-3-methyl-5-hydroxy-6-metoxy-1,4-benzoquinol methylase
MTGENDILESWEANAGNWIQTVTNQELESRRLVTDDAIVQAVMHYAPARILDLGCGEGWLSRALRRKGLEVWGTDGIAALVERAIAADGPFYYQYTYREIAKGPTCIACPVRCSGDQLCFVGQGRFGEFVSLTPSVIA